MKKVPVTANGRPASSTDSATWCSYRDAVRSTAGAGVGFVLNGDGIACLDLDHCLVDGKPAAWAQRILDRVPATYVEVSRIPMMFRVPGLRHRRVEALAHPGDVTATLLELGGMRAPETMRTRSLVPVLRNGEPGPRPVAVSSWSLRGRRKTRPSVIRDAEWSLVFWRTGVPPELYHRPTDPGETNDVSAQHPAEVRRLHGEFLRFLRENETPPRNYWPRHWLVNWGSSQGWQNAIRQSHGAGA